VIGFSDRRVRLVTVAIGVAGLIAAATTPADAQDISVNFAQGSGLTERVIQLIALLTVLSLAPSILVMMTSFTRIVVVLSLLRTALGTATAPQPQSGRPRMRSSARIPIGLRDNAVMQPFQPATMPVATA